MSYKQTRVNPLKNKFNKVEKQFRPEEEEIILNASKFDTHSTCDVEDMLIEESVKENAKSIKDYRKLLAKTEVQLSKNSSDLTDLLAMKSSRHHKIEALSKLISQNKEQLGEVQSLNSNINTERIQEESRLGRMQTRRIELETEIAQQLREKETLQIDYNNLINAVYSKQSENEIALEELATLKEKYNRGQVEYSREENKHKSLERDVHANDFKLQKVRAEFNAVANQNNNLQFKIKALEANIEEVKSQTAEVEITTFDLKGNEKRFTAQVIELHNRLATYKHNYENSLKCSTEIERKITTLIDVKENLASEIKVAKQSFEKVNFDTDSILRDQVSAKKEIKLHESAKKTILADIRIVENRNSELLRDIDSLAAEMKMVENEIQIKKLHQSRVQAESIKLTKNNQTLKENINHLSDRYKKEDGAFDMLQKEFNVLQAENHDWKSKTAKLDIHIQNLVKNAEEIKQNIIEAIQATKVYKSEGPIKQEKAIAAQKRVNALQSKLSEVEATSTKWESKLTDARSASDMWSKKVSIKEQHLEEACEKVMTGKAELLQLENAVNNNETRFEQFNIALTANRSEQKVMTRRLENLQVKKSSQANEYTSLSAEYDEGQLVNKEIKEKLISENQKIENQQMMIAELNSKKEDVILAIQGARRKHSILLNESEKVTNTIHLLEEETKPYDQKFDGLNHLVHNANTELEGLAAQVNALAQNKQSLKKNIISKEKLLVRLTRQEAEMNNDIKKAEKDIPKFETQSVDLDHKITTLTNSVQEKALELQSKRSVIRTMTTKNGSKQEELEIVTTKSKQMQQRVDSIKQENSEFGAHVGTMGETIKAAQMRNISISKKIQNETDINDQFKSKISELKNEIKKINSSYQLEKGKMSQYNEERKSYQEQLHYLTAKKESLLDGIESNTTAYYVDKEAIQSMQAEINKVKSDISKISGMKDKKSTISTSELIRSMQELKLAVKSDIENKKSQSVLINCVNEITFTMTENEFDQMYWTAKLNEGKSESNIVLNFKKMEMTHQDLKAILKPLIEALGMRFKAHGLSINSKTSRKGSSDVINGLEMNLVITKPIVKAQVEPNN